MGNVTFYAHVKIYKGLSSWRLARRAEVPIPGNPVYNAAQIAFGNRYLHARER
jgi:hypothetical protein